MEKKTCKIDINGVKTPSTLTIIRVSSPQPDEPGKCLQRWNLCCFKQLGFT